MGQLETKENEYEVIYGNPYRLAEATGKDWRKSKRRNWKRYATYRNQVKNDSIDARDFFARFVKAKFADRHTDAKVKADLVETIHIAKYLREVTKQLK